MYGVVVDDAKVCRGSGAHAVGREITPIRPLGASDPGLPVFSNDEVVGMTTSGQEVASIDSIRAFLDSQAGVLAAVP